MRFQGICYRSHNPRWAWTPLSGEGARIDGGRFNPIGIATFYLGLSLEIALLETTNGFNGLFNPITLCSYKVDVDNLVDLRDDADRKKVGVDLAELSCAWELDRLNGKIPASWSMADTLIKQGAAGILVPSFANGARESMCNMVLWKWSAELPYKVELHDPDGRLKQL